jgi:tRNA pseudouridine55 synthase
MVDYREGQILLVDKELKWTSFDVVNKLRYALKRRYDVKKFKVGHAGTIDPLASGLLLICTGKKTKEIESMMGLEKEYTGSIQLGGTTASYDLETEVIPTNKLVTPTKNELETAMHSFLGEQEQTPPIYSAKRHKGRKSYLLAREGKVFQPKSALVNILEFELLDFQDGRVDFRLKCSKGTYVRSLAHDLGQKLTCGAYLSALRRTKIGDFSVDDSKSVQAWVEQIEKSSGATQNNIDLNS